MKLYILRHGDAPYDRQCGERVLSEQGKSDIQCVVKRHREELAELSLILCSPTRRARETLAVASHLLGYQGPLLFEDCLRSGSHINDVERYIDNLCVESLLLVSHQPLVGYMLDYLVDQPGSGVILTTSSLVCLDLITFGRGGGTLKWLDSPEKIQ